MVQRDATSIGVSVTVDLRRRLQRAKHIPGIEVGIWPILLATPGLNLLAAE